MRRKSPKLLFFLFNRLMSRQRSLRATMPFSGCDVEMAFSRRPRDTERKVSSISAQRWSRLKSVERKRSAAVECNLALLCAVLGGSRSYWQR